MERPVMPPYSLLFENQRPRHRQLHHQNRKKHNRRKQQDSCQRPQNIHRTLHHTVKRIRQGYMTDIDNCQSQQILRIWFRGNNNIIIRYKLCMHAGFLTQRHDMLQLKIFIQSQRNHNFIQTVFRQDDHQIVNTPDNLYILISCSPRHIVIQNAPYQIAPLGILPDSVNVFLCRAAVPH